MKQVSPGIFEAESPEEEAMLQAGTDWQAIMAAFQANEGAYMLTTRLPENTSP